jgi:hypothetical protein
LPNFSQLFPSQVSSLPPAPITSPTGDDAYEDTPYARSLDWLGFFFAHSCLCFVASLTSTALLLTLPHPLVLLVPAVLLHLHRRPFRCRRAAKCVCQPMRLLAWVWAAAAELAVAAARGRRLRPLL